ncbi:MAG: DUF4097 domain-containing protein [Endomicrobium sp.]|jgi:hypothetical protein|nr:DUF4097 domain-containing protein [Endomicrobium sp.]
MNKFLFVLAFCFVTCYSYAENYIFPAKNINEIDIIIKNGKLNVKSANVREIRIDITPSKSSSTDRQIYVVGGKELNVYLVDSEITENTTVNIIVPKTADMEINSTLANVTVDNLSGFLSIDAAAGSVTVNNFNGKAEIDTIDAKVDISGFFKALDIESSKADINVTLNKVPSFYTYAIHGAGKMIFNLDKSVKRNNLVIDSHEFKGTLEIK